MSQETTPAENDDSPAVDQCVENLSFVYFYTGSEQVYIRPENIVAVIVLVGEHRGWDVKIETTLGFWRVRSFSSEASARSFAFSLLRILPDIASRRIEAEEKGHA